MKEVKRELLLGLALLMPVTAYLLPFFCTGILGLLLVTFAAQTRGFKGGLLSSVWSSSFMVLIYLSPVDSISSIGVVTAILCFFLFGLGLGKSVDLIKRQQYEIEETNLRLIQEKEFIAKILDTQAALVILLDREGRILRFNKACEEITKYKSSEVVGEKVWDLFFLEEDIDEAKDIFYGILEGERSYHDENYLPSKDGNLSLISWSSTVMTDSKGEVNYVIATGMDITKRKEMEGSLKKSEKRLETLISETPAVIYSYRILEGEPDVEYVSKNIENVLGYRPDELIHNTQLFIDSIHPEDRELVLSIVPRLLEEGSITLEEYRFRDREGYYHYLHDEQRVVQYEDGSWEVIGAWWDITQRKEMEIELKESKKRFSLAQTFAGMGTWEYDMKTSRLYWSRECETLFGLEEGEFGGTFEEFLLQVHPDDREYVKKVNRSIVERRERIPLDYEHRIVRRDGEVCWVRERAWVIDDGTSSGLIGLVMDITQWREAREALQTMIEEQEILLDHTAIQIWYLEDEKTYGKVNRAHAEFMGVEKEDLENKSLYEIMSTEEEAEICIEGNQRVFSIKEKVHTEEWVIDGQGERRLLTIVKTPKCNVSGEVEYVVCHAQDTTLQREMEERLAYQYAFQKLVATISYDFINASRKKMDTIIDGTLRRIGHFFHVDHVQLFKISPEDEEIHITHSWSVEGKDRPYEKRKTLSMESLHWLIEEIKREGHLNLDVGLLSQREVKRVLQDQSRGSLLCIPLTKYGDLSGFIGLETVERESTWSDEDITLLKVIGEIIANVSAKHQIEEDLIESEKRYRTLVSNVPGIIFRCDYDQESTMRLMSDEIEEITGYPAGDFLSGLCSYSSIIHPGDQEMVTRVIEESLSSRNSYTVQYRVIHAHGSIRWVHEKGQRVLAKDGSIECIDGVIIDITERKEAEEELASRIKEIESLYSRLDLEMEKARRIHEQILPTTLPTVEGVSFAAHYQPAYRLGGDFYDVIRVENKLVLYLSDVSGHGLDGSMLSVFVKETIKGYLSFSSPEEIRPESILRYLAESFGEEKYPEEYFISIFLGVIDLKNMQLTYTGAGFQDTPFVRMGDGTSLQLISKGLYITSFISPSLLNLKEDQIKLTPYTTIFFNTDGLTEQRTAGEFYRDRLSDVFYENSYLSPDLIASAVALDFQLFNRGALQGDDDITFLVLQVEPLEEKRYTLHLATDSFALESMHEKVFKMLSDHKGLDVERVLACLHELVANAMEHGNKMDPEKRVSLEFVVMDESIRLSVEDEGEGFNWRDRIYAPFLLHEVKERGRGIAMTRILADGLFYDDKGNKATFVLSRRKY